MPVQIQFQPTLFIFLGTTSGQIGWRLKKSLYDAYGKVPLLRFLWIDLDSEVSTEARPWFTKQERVELWGFNAAEVINHLDNFHEIKEWWPGDAKIPPGLLVGEGSPRQMRLVGRLSLFKQFNDRTQGPSLYDKLSTACENLFTIDNIEQTKAMSNDQVSYNVKEGCQVYITFSPCGGTGSSMAFDIAYLCRHLPHGKSPKITGISMLPSVIEKSMKGGMDAQRQKMYANAYAWFKEDNNLAENPAWNVNYPGGVKVDLPAPPFNFRYLIDIENQVGQLLNSSADVFNMIAQALFTLSCTSIAGDFKSFDAIVAGLGEPFQGIKRNYSSFVAASLLYPKNRLLEYCGIRLAKDFIDQGLLSEVPHKEVTIQTSALLSQLGLRDADLISSLLENRFIKMEQEPIINKADSVAAALSYIDKQEAQNSGSLITELEKLNQFTEEKLNQINLNLDRSIANYSIQYGLNFSLSILDMLLDEAPRGAIGQNINSLDGLRERIIQQGASEKDIAVARQELEQDKNGIKRLDDGPEDILERKLRPSNWNKKFSLYKAECIGDMREINATSIQLAAQQKAISIYERLISQVQELKRRVQRTLSTLERTSVEYEKIAEDLSQFQQAQTSGFDFSREIEVDFPAYYENHSKNIDIKSEFSAMFPPSANDEFSTLEKWITEDTKTAGPEYGKTFFIEDLDSITILDALEELAERQGVDPNNLITQHLEGILNYCHPFWRWDNNRGLGSMDNMNVIGVENENSPLIPEVYKNEAEYSIKTTLVKDRIDILKVLHGLPAFLLHDFGEYKSWYETKRKDGIDPLHVLPGMEFVTDIMPDYSKRYRETFAVGFVFGYIVHAGEYFYYDPERGYSEHVIEPERAFRLAQDRSEAEEVFARKENWAKQAQEDIDTDIKRMRNEAAIDKMEDAIQLHLENIKKLKQNAPLRKQFEKEINYLHNMQRRLGKVF